MRLIYLSRILWNLPSCLLVPSSQYYVLVVRIDLDACQVQRIFDWLLVSLVDLMQGQLAVHHIYKQVPEPVSFSHTA